MLSLGGYLQESLGFIGFANWFSITNPVEWVHHLWIGRYTMVFTGAPWTSSRREQRAHQSSTGQPVSMENLHREWGERGRRPLGSSPEVDGVAWWLWCPGIEERRRWCLELGGRAIRVWMEWAIVPRSEKVGLKPLYVCSGCSIHTHSNNMIHMHCSIKHSNQSLHNNQWVLKMFTQMQRN
jgi:hypothetical protein